MSMHNFSRHGQRESEMPSIYFIMPEYFSPYHISFLNISLIMVMNTYFLFRSTKSEYMDYVCKFEVDVLYALELY